MALAYETETFDGDDYPSPGEWSLNWATEQVVSWYYGDEKRDAVYAHLYDTPKSTHIEVGDTRVDLDDEPRSTLHAAVARALRNHAPDND